MVAADRRGHSQPALFEKISEIEEALVERCVELLDQAGTIKGLTNYHWWPQAA